VKKQFNVYLDEKLIMDFREFVAAKYGMVKKGCLGYEVAQALKWLMNTHKDTQSKGKKTTPHPVPNVLIYAAQVRDYLMDHFGYEKDLLDSVPKAHLVIALSAIRGTDRRTIRKWMKLFEKWKVMKWK